MKKTFAALFFALLAAISSNTAALHCNSAEEAMIGDINGDALVDGRDATALLTAYASESAGKTDTLSAEQRRVADVNRDDIADGRDATVILTYYAKQSAGEDILFETYLESINTDIVSSMPLHDKICQMFIVRPEELTNGAEYYSASEKLKDSLKEYPVGGLILFTNNMRSQEQVTEFISGVKEYSSEIGCVPLFFGVDEEGGSVSRCAEALGTASFEPMFNYRYMGTDKARSNARTIAEDIGKLGFDLDFAPVADTWSNKYNTVIGGRAYSDDFKETANLVGSAVKGFMDGGIHCTLKHFPGHGDTIEDSHYGFAVSHRSAEQLRNNEYLAFDKGIKAGADIVMVGHITVPAIDDHPASMSEKLIQGELRGTLGFDGVIMTDALGMGAIANAYSSSVCSVMAVEAGNDILLSPKDLREAVDGIEAAVSNGLISEERINESVRRILKVKGLLE